jgi:hypothetical protein
MTRTTAWTSTTASEMHLVTCRRAKLEALMRGDVYHVRRKSVCNGMPGGAQAYASSSSPGRGWWRPVSACPPAALRTGPRAFTIAASTLADPRRTSGPRPSREPSWHVRAVGVPRTARSTPAPRRGSVQRGTPRSGCWCASSPCRRRQCSTSTRALSGRSIGPPGAWARVVGDQVVEGGAGGIWEAIEDVYAWRHAAGVPERPEIGLRVKREGRQRLWLRRPDWCVATDGAPESGVTPQRGSGGGRSRRRTAVGPPAPARCGRGRGGSASHRPR